MFRKRMPTRLCIHLMAFVIVCCFVYAFFAIPAEGANCTHPYTTATGEAIYDIPQGGCTIPLRGAGASPSFTIRNISRHDAHDIEIMVTDADGNYKDANIYHIRSFSSNLMPDATINPDHRSFVRSVARGNDALNNCNPRTRAGERMEFNIQFSRPPDPGDKISVSLSRKLGEDRYTSISLEEEIEPNDSIPQALSLDSNDYVAALDSGQDIDYYRFNVPEDNTTVNLMVRDSASTTLAMQLFDSMMGLVQTAEIYPDQPLPALNIENLRHGDYYARIYDRASKGTDHYVMRLFIDSPFHPEGEEDDSGALDIAGTKAMLGGSVSIPVRIQSVPNDIAAFGFIVTFDPSVLTYTGWQQGGLLASFPVVDVSLISPGHLKAGGLSFNSAIPKGTSGDFVLLSFEVSGGQDGAYYQLGLNDLTDNLARFHSSGGLFRVSNCDGDLNEDGKITPADAKIAFECYLDTGPCSDCADVNQDGRITPEDARCLLSKYMEIPSCFPDEDTQAKTPCKATIPFPDGVATISLSQPAITSAGEIVKGRVLIRDGLLTRENLLSIPGPLSVVVKVESLGIVMFPDESATFEHIIDHRYLNNDGSYGFPFELAGCQPGEISLSLSLKAGFLGEGLCATAINGVYAGCWIGGQLNKDCVCSSLADMPAPGSWACSAFPLTFRAAWRLWGCSGASPY